MFENWRVGSVVQSDTSSTLSNGERFRPLDAAGWSASTGQQFFGHWRKGDEAVSLRLQTDRHSVIGEPYCCAWWNGLGEIRVQFRDYDLARKFQKSRFNSHLTAYAVAGGYMQIFIVKGKSLNWFKRWLARNDQPK